MHLVRDGGEQHQPEYAAVNPQHLVPTLLHGVRVIRQSLAILEYLDEAWPSPRLLPMTARDRARVRAPGAAGRQRHPPAQQPARAAATSSTTWSVPQSERDEWIRHWISEGFEAMEALLDGDPATGAFCHGQAPGLADCCLVPQVYNARRFGVDMARVPDHRADRGGLPGVARLHRGAPGHGSRTRSRSA